MAEAEKDDWLDDLDSPGDQGSELDQSDIDALISGPATQGSPSPGPDAGEGEELELGQTDIDALLAGVDDSGGGGLDSSDLDQADIDALLAGPKTGTRDQTATDPDQDEIDKLFSDVDSNGGVTEDTPFPAEETDFKDIFDATDSATQTGLPDFDAEEFKLDADIPDIPDTTGFDLESTDIFNDVTVASPPPQPAGNTETVPETPPEGPPSIAEPVPTAKPWNLLGNRKALYGVCAGLVSLLIGAGLFLFQGTPPPSEVGGQKVVTHPQAPEEKAPKPLPPAESPPSEAAPPPPTAMVENGAPTVNDLDLTLPPESSQLSITLCGIDPEKAPLEYEFQSMPEHGQLSGHAPNLIYTPTSGYSGPDGFTVRATDGRNYSAPALIKINREPPLPSAQESLVPLVVARPQVSEEIKRAKPKPVAKVKRKQGKVVAKAKRVKKIRKNQAPVIVLQPIAPVYNTGDSVIMNAGPTHDDSRETLCFLWEQLAGVPVAIKPLTSEGSLVSFVAPATFNTVANPTLVFRVTATDKDGAQDSREITITTKSRRHSALWRGGRQE